MKALELVTSTLTSSYQRSSDGSLFDAIRSWSMRLALRRLPRPTMSSTKPRDAGDRQSPATRAEQSVGERSLDGDGRSRSTFS